MVGKPTLGVVVRQTVRAEPGEVTKFIAEFGIWNDNLMDHRGGVVFISPWLVVSVILEDGVTIEYKPLSEDGLALMRVIRLKVEERFGKSAYVVKPP